MLFLAVSLAISTVAPSAGEAAVLSYISIIQQRQSRPIDNLIAEQASRLGSRDEEERIDAALKLAALRTPLALPALASALEDRDERVRAIAIDGLAAIADPQVVPLIVARLNEDRKVFVRKTAAYALGRLGSSAGTGALLGALKDKEVEVRGAAAVALTMYRDSSAVDGLIAALGDSSDFVREHAALALGVNGKAARRATPRLIQGLDSDPSIPVKRQAAIALGLIGDPSARASLERARLSPDHILGRAAAAALERINK